LLQDKEADSPYQVVLSGCSFAENSPRDIDFADMVLSTIGGTPLSKEAHPPKRGRDAFAEQQRVNFLVAVDSIEIGLELDDMLHSAVRVLLGRSAYARDAAASLATLLTGAPGSVHGIVGSVWLDSQTGQKVTAFTHAGQCVAPTLLDAASLSLTDADLVAFSAAPVMAAALAPHVHDELCPRTGSIAACSLAETEDAFPSLGPKSACAELSAHSADLRLLARLTRVSLEQEERAIVVSADGVTASFSTDYSETMTFLKELEVALRLTEQRNEQRDQLTFLALTGLKGIRSVYGDNSPQALVGEKLTLAVVASMINGLPAHATSQVVFLGQPKQQRVQDAARVLEGTHVALVVSDLLLPELFVDGFFPGASSEVESIVMDVAAGNNVMVVPLNPISQTDVASAPFALFNLDVSDGIGMGMGMGAQNNGTGGNSTASGGSTSGSNGGPAYTQEQLENFQIILWTALLFVLLALVASYSLFSMDSSRDTLVFRYGTPNRPHAA